MTTATPTQSYDVSWDVTALLRASMTVEAPAGLSEEELKTFILKECSADFVIDTDDFEYDHGFSDLDCGFSFECPE